MSLLNGLRARLRALFFRRQADRALDDEIRFHLELETDKNIRAGHAPAEARRLAVAHFGGADHVRETHRDVRRLRWLEDAAADARFALRALRRTPSLTTAAVITLALGIGANVAIFSAVNAVVLRPLPFPGSHRLMLIGENNPEKHWHMQYAAPANMLDWRAGVRDFTDVMAYFDGVGHTTMTGRGRPDVLAMNIVTGNFFSVLGVRPLLGRAFTWQETFAASDTVKVYPIVLSYRGWQDHFGGDPSIVGKSITLDGLTAQVIGVMPEGFAYPKDGIALWQTYEWGPHERTAVSFRRAHGIRVVARLAPGATRAHADAELQSVVERLQRQYPETNRVMGAGMVPLHDFLVGDTRLPLLVLLVSVGFLLLIACANVGNLLLVQASGRHREAALRLALGAGRGRLVRQAITESLVLSTLGGACGLAVGWAGTRALVRLQPAGMLRVHDFGLDPSVFAYVAAITLVSGLIFGVAPAFWARHRDPADALKDGGRGALPGVRTKRWGQTLVVAEVALALVMTVGAGLLVRSFLRMRRVDPGFDPHGVFVGSVNLSNAYDDNAKITAFMSRLEARVRALPGVTGVGMAMNVPLTGASWTSDFIAYGRPADGYGTEIANTVVSPGYFATMKVPLAAGRVFTPADRDTTAPVLVINETLARTYFKGENPVGQRLTFDKAPTPKSTWYTIVGVVGDEHADALDVAPTIEAYHSSIDEPSTYMRLVARTTGDPAALATPVRAVLTDLDPSMTLLSTTTMDALRDASLARTRFLTMLMLMFGAIGVVLAVVGVYGVLAQVSRNRTREMGIRIALGAQASQVRWLVVRQGLALTAVGLVIGGAVAHEATHAMATLLFQVQPNDPLTLWSVVVLLALTSVAAAWLPASRASGADPAMALRAD